MNNVRAHATWSASASHRYFECPGSLTLIQALPPTPEGRAAAWGTACHSVSAKALTEGKNASAYLGTTETTERFAFIVDEEMVDCAQVYIDYCRERMEANPDAECWIEEPFSLNSLGTPFDSGGITDCCLYYPRIETLENVDLKTGRGIIVEVENNTQLRTYGLGGFLRFQGKKKISQIKTTIVQPRAPHKDGIIRSEMFHVSDLIDWTTDMLVAMGRAEVARNLYRQIEGNSIKFDEWSDAHLKVGPQCDWCPVAGSCPAQRREALKVAGVWFDYDGIAQMTPNDLAENTPAVVERDLDLLEQLESWIRARRALAHEMAEQGIEFRNWQLVEKFGHRKFDYPSEADAVKAIREIMPISDDQLFDRKLKTPAGIERSVGKKIARKLDPIITKPLIGTDLVRADRSKVPREPAPSIAERYFQEE
jgi:hypothetical protein